VGTRRPPPAVLVAAPGAVGNGPGTFGKAPNALRIMAHAKATFLSTALHEGVYSLSRVAPLRLKVLAGQRVSSLVGCSW
jgi:hypothetical protein